MKSCTQSRPSMCLKHLMLAVTLWSLSSITLSADESPQMPSTDLHADCECHVIGIYTPEKAYTDDRVYVKVTNTGKPMVIVLCSYFDTQWNLEFDEDAEVRQIIVSGWFEQATVGIPETIPLKTIVGSPQVEAPDKNYFWGYALETKEGRNVRKRIKELTGLDMTSFQGTYQGKQFVIDGQAGRLSVAEPVNPARAAIRFDATQDRKTVESNVRKLFELDLKERQDRVARAEEDLKRIKANLAKRQASAEKIIAAQVESLMQSQATKPESVEDPTAEGWRLWNQSKWDEALPLFLAAVAKQPDNAHAWNGLGWTRFHLMQWDDAVTAFDRALELDATQLGARNGRGRIRMNQGKLDDAEADLLQGTNDSIKMFGETQAITGGVTASWFGLVEVNLAQKDYATAKEWADRYLKTKPDDASMKRLSMLATPSP